MKEREKRIHLHGAGKRLPPVRLNVLGNFFLDHDGGGEFHVATKKNRALLAILALSPGMMSTRERLSGILWGDKSDDQARSSLRQSLAVLRKELGYLEELMLDSQSDIIALRGDAVNVDVLEFYALSRSSNRDLLRRAKDLLSGQILEDISVRGTGFETWISAENAKLNTATITLFDQLVFLEEGQVQINVAQQLIGIDPLRESSHRSLMHAYFSQGENGLALKQFDICSRLLNEELGVEPAEETKALRNAILDGKRHSSQQSVVENVNKVERIQFPKAGSKPIIAVLPFINMGCDAEQDFFSDGITEDIITDLSKVPGLFVLGRATVFAYKSKALGLERLVNEFGAAYVVEGSVRRVGSRVRINVQLTEGASGGQLWADRYDRDLVDVFNVQDEVTRCIVESITGKIGAPRVFERYKPTNLEAYDLVLRSRWRWTVSIEACLEAQNLLARAIELDPNYPEAHWLMAQTLLFNWMVWNGSPDPDRKNAMMSARRALELAPNENWAHSVMAYVLLGELKWEESRIEFHRALEINPNDADILLGVADYYIATSEPFKAMEYLATSLRLNPSPSGAYFWELGEVQTSIGHYAEAVVTLRREETYNTASRRALIVALALLGDIEGAKKEAKLFLASSPRWTIGSWEIAMPFKSPEQTKTWIDAFRLAGLPE